MNSSFSISEIFKDSFHFFGKNWVKILLAQLIGLALSFVLVFILFFGSIALNINFFENPTLSVQLIASMLITFVLFVVTVAYINAGLLNFYIHLVNGDATVSPKVIFKTRVKILLNYLVLGVLLILIFLGGFILLIIPAIIFMLMYSLSQMYVIDQKMGPISALKKSAQVTKGHKFEIFLICLLMIGMSLLVGLVGTVGVIMSTFFLQPIFMIIFISIYKKLDAAYMAKNGGASTPVPQPAMHTEKVTDLEIQPTEITAPAKETETSTEEK